MTLFERILIRILTTVVADIHAYIKYNMGYAGGASYPTLVNEVFDDVDDAIDLYTNH